MSLNTTSQSQSQGQAEMTAPKKVELELVGLDGNAFALMGAFQRAARQQGWSKEQIAAVLAECQSGDYNHLLSTLMSNTVSPEERDED